MKSAGVKLAFGNDFIIVLHQLPVVNLTKLFSPSVMWLTYNSVTLTSVAFAGTA